MFALDDRHASLVDRLLVHTFTRIASGEWPGGSRITEDQIAADFGVSRTPVREAVRRLSEMGLLVVHPRRKLEITSVDQSDLAEITELRATLECMAIRLAMRRMTAADVQKLERLVAACEEQLKTRNRLEIFRLDGQFHLAIADRSGNRYLTDALRKLEVKVQLCRMLLCASERKIRASVRFHREILAAIQAGDAAQAERLLLQHICNALTAS